MVGSLLYQIIYYKKNKRGNVCVCDGGEGGEELTRNYPLTIWPVSFKHFYHFDLTETLFHSQGKLKSRKLMYASTVAEQLNGTEDISGI